MDHLREWEIDATTAVRFGLPFNQFGVPNPHFHAARARLERGNSIAVFVRPASPLRPWGSAHERIDSFIAACL